MKTKLFVFLTTAVLGLVLASFAAAHVTVHPNALPSGGFTVVNVHVPNEVDTARTIKVDVQVPPGIFFLTTELSLSRTGSRATVRAFAFAFYDGLVAGIERDEGVREHGTQSRGVADRGSRLVGLPTALLRSTCQSAIRTL